MEELIQYFKTAPRPIEPIRITIWVEVTDSKEFIDSCYHLYAMGDEEGFFMLKRYKEAIEELKQPALAN